MNIDLLSDAGAVTVIVGWVELVKRYFKDEKEYFKFLPILAILAGIIYTTTVKPGELPLVQKILLGFGLGITAAGAQDVTKQALKILPKKEE